MRRSFKERGKRLLNKFSGDGSTLQTTPTAASATGESQLVSQSAVECECKFNTKFARVLTERGLINAGTD